MSDDREKRVALVTGGLRGLGRAMSLGLAKAGHPVVAVGHIESDIAEMTAEAERLGAGKRFHPLVADLREKSECDCVVAASRERFGRIDILVNNAGLTFTYIDPARFRRNSLQRFWQVGDEIVDNVITTNYLAADRLSRRVAPEMMERRWGRIVNVTTKLDTMNRVGTHPYGASKAALEMATEVWAKDAADTGLTVNIVNPGAGANTPGMAEEMRVASREGRVSRLVEPDEMVPPLLYVVSTAADEVNGWRFDANLWNPDLPRSRPPGSPAAPPGSSSIRTRICRRRLDRCQKRTSWPDLFRPSSERLPTLRIWKTLLDPRDKPGDDGLKNADDRNGPISLARRNRGRHGARLGARAECAQRRWA